MKLKSKHGFTLVELVIVIAVIAILAGALIPTFSGVIDKARQSAALQERKNKELENEIEKQGSDINRNNAYFIGEYKSTNIYLKGQEPPFYGSSISSEVISDNFKDHDLFKITLLKDNVFSSSYPIEIDEGKTLIINLNGHNLTLDQSGADSSLSCLFYLNGGTLKFYDKIGQNGSIKVNGVSCIIYCSLSSKIKIERAIIKNETIDGYGIDFNNTASTLYLGAGEVDMITNKYRNDSNAKIDIIGYLE